MTGKEASEGNIEGGRAEAALTTEAAFIELVRGLSHELGFAGKTIERAEVEDLSGNINRVRRVQVWFPDGLKRSFVVKHVPEGGRLERYPSIVFPENRLSFEVLWFDFSKRLEHERAVRTPTVLHFSKDKHTSIMEDLAPLCSFGEFLRQSQGREPEDLLKALGSFLGQVHKATIGSVVFSNPGAALNRPYVFTLPLKEAAQMRVIWQEREGPLGPLEEEECGSGISLNKRIELQELYLRTSAEHVLPVLIELERSFKKGRWSVLTHGDLHTDSVLVLSGSRLGVLDAELCDYGTPAFDLGMLSAHVWACSVSSGHSESVVGARLSAFLEGYMEGFWRGVKVNSNEKLELLHGTGMHCGAEILRRLLGAAGFPFVLTGEQFEELLTTATKLLTSPAELTSRWLIAAKMGR